MIPQAVNNLVFIIRDKTESEKSGVLIPPSGRTKPHRGIVVSVGDLVQDKKIKSSKNKFVLFHPTVGQEIDYDGTTYLVLEDRQVIAIV